jgi:5'-AMP-activated protein kinase regulatory gamma subunit
MMDPEPASARPDLLHNEREVVRSAGRQAISAFLEAHTCFSVLRASGKVVVFDTRIPIQLAFYALVEHGE